MKSFVSSALILSILVFAASSASATPWASEVLSYNAGSNCPAGYNQSAAALGEPSRSYYDSAWNFGGDITPFCGPYLADQVVSIGAGGDLVVAFDHPVMDDPANPYGADLLVFGNAFYYDSDYPNGIAGMLSEEPAKIAVSQDGNTWVDITDVLADALYPTLGYTNTSAPYASDGTIKADFTKPVDPSFDPAGKTFSEIVAGYNGSGGGAGVDISGTGLGWIRYVKVSVDSTADYASEIDGFADVAAVPEPMSLLTLIIGIPTVMLGRKNG